MQNFNLSKMLRTQASEDDFLANNSANNIKSCFEANNVFKSLKES